MVENTTPYMVEGVLKDLPADSTVLLFSIS